MTSIDIIVINIYAYPINSPYTANSTKVYRHRNSTIVTTAIVAIVFVLHHHFRRWLTTKIWHSTAKKTIQWKTKQKTVRLATAIAQNFQNTFKSLIDHHPQKQLPLTFPKALLPTTF
jgi:uncharacterized protein HemY